MESNEKEKMEELIGTTYCHIKYPNIMAFEQILIAFFGCISFEEISSDLFEKMNLLIRKIPNFHKENKNNTFVWGMLIFILMRIFG